MTDASSDELSENQPLEYSRRKNNLVLLARYSVTYEAEMAASALAAEGIHAEVFGANTNAMNWFWQGFNKAELFVPAEEAERAAEIIAHTKTDELEPVSMPADAPPPTDEEGHPIVPVGEYATLRELQDAQTVLGSADIVGYAPPMTPRGDQAPGQGKRFILRVSEGDAERAKSLLEAEAEEDSEEPRCPKCGSWRSVEHEGFFGGLGAMFGIQPKSQMECVNCHYRAPKDEFLRHDSTK